MKREPGQGTGKLARLLGIILILGAMLVVSACSGSSDNDDAGNAAAAAPAEPMSAANAVEKSSLSAADQFAANEQAAPSSEPQAASGGGAAQGAMGSIGPIADADAQFGRKVIYQANLVMKVESFLKADEQLMNLIHMTAGAYVLEFSDSRNPDETGATYVIKVPSSGFSAFLDGLKGIKTVRLERNVSGNDVTEEYVDLDARLKAKQTVEARLLAFMDKATQTDDLVRFSNELGNVQQEIEQIKGRIRYLDQNVAFSTVSLRLYQGSGTEPMADEASKEDKNFGDRIYDALSGSANVLRQFGEGLLVVVAAVLPVLIVASVVGLPVYLFVRKRAAFRKERAAERRSELRAYNRDLESANDQTAEDAEAATRSVDTPSDTNPDNRTDV